MLILSMKNSDETIHNSFASPQKGRVAMGRIKDTGAARKCAPGPSRGLGGPPGASPDSLGDSQDGFLRLWPI